MGQSNSEVASAGQHYKMPQNATQPTILWESCMHMHISLSLGPQQVAPTRYLYLEAMLPHANGDFEYVLTSPMLHTSLRTQRSGCVLGATKLQLGARRLNCSRNFFPNVVTARTPGASKLGSL